MKRARTLVASASAAVLLLVSGCGAQFGGVYDLPLPGGADLGADPYDVRIHFRDVLDLVPRAGVRVDDVPVGEVKAIDVADDGWTAEVTVSVNEDVDLPANAVANVRQSSLLGEKYVALSAPAQRPAEAELADGDLIPLERTDRSVEVEEILGALSMLLNGGGVEQLNTITRELNAALEGNEQDVRAMLNNTEQLVATLDEQSSDITRALDALDRLSATLTGQKDEIANAVENLGPGLEVLEDQRGRLVDMLTAFEQLSDVAVETVNASHEDLVANLESLLPTLRKLAEAGADLPKALELMLTYPFTDAAAEGVKGDYMNLYATIDLNLGEILANLGRSRQNPLGNLPVLGDLTDGGEGGDTPPLPLPGESADAGGDSGSGTESGVGGLLDSLTGGAR
ncbi:MCE family protein [Saccharomonospora iraqiensis]|uniref:MCE family protein n=1 Tax=Saccharomonospora iraqiensis TaxID=52698 RepID=UPI00022E5395|nr:MCE family protein [Saccharomonospora iraqiensis]